MLAIYFDLDSKMHKEFRAYGANMTITAPGAAAAPGTEALPDGTLARVENTLGSRAIAAPFAFAVVNAADGTPVVVAGTDLDPARRMNGWWSVSQWPEAGKPDAVLVGAKAERLFASGPTQEFNFQGRTMRLTSAGVLKTGGPEENRIYLPLDQFIAWTGLKPSLIEASFAGSSEQIEAALQSLASLRPPVEARPIRQIVDAESGIVGKMRAVIFSALVLITVMVALCVLASLTSSVLERRRDFALMKALGSTQARVTFLFACETGLLGAAAGLVGFGLGSAVAAWIGAVNFHAAIGLRFSLLPPVFFATVLLALGAALFALGRLQQLEPAMILKGD
jgi:putative ABC transport system permease protein